ncbi:MAG: hypothetical protein Ct9H90mP18_03810 [Gammaproteobacteria bacterium]|nr:MAG: hypothetical protein Ct9H90mP18_03810 [Gammaproteobacteria bacterium]
MNTSHAFVEAVSKDINYQLHIILINHIQTGLTKLIFIVPKVLRQCISRV